MVYEKLFDPFNGYKQEPHSVRWLGVFIYPEHTDNPEIALKSYGLVNDNHRLIPLPIIEFKGKFLREEVEKGKMNLRGLGFSILSNGFLNVAVWNLVSGEIILKNKMYIYQNNLKTAQVIDINREGAFCKWEEQIAAHERESLERYLNSQKTEEDKKRFLYEDRIEGRL